MYVKSEEEGRETVIEKATKALVNYPLIHKKSTVIKSAKRP